MCIRHQDIYSIRSLLQSPVKKQDRERTTTPHPALLADLDPRIRQRRTKAPLRVQGVPAVAVAPTPPRHRRLMLPHIKTDFRIAVSICLPPPLAVPRNAMVHLNHGHQHPLRLAANHTRPAKVLIGHQQPSRLQPPVIARVSPASTATKHPRNVLAQK